jgi:hypothetical protein
VEINKGKDDAMHEKDPIHIAFCISFRVGAACPTPIGPGQKHPKAVLPSVIMSQEHGTVNVSEYIFSHFILRDRSDYFGIGNIDNEGLF